MRLTPFAVTGVLLASPALAQTLTREYRLPFSDAESSVGTTEASASVGSFSYPLPSVVEGPLVRVVEVGFSVEGTRRIEADYVNTTAAPLVLETGLVAVEFFALVGDPAGCAIGVDACGVNCTSGGGITTVPPGSTQTLVQVDDTVQEEAFAAPGDLAWPCILSFSGLNTTVDAAISFAESTEVRADVTISGFTEARAELTLNPSISSSCAGAPNSLGLSTRIDYFGSSDASEARAAVRASDMPAGVATLCIITDAFGTTPLGAGPLPSLCLRGARTSQQVKFSEPAGAAGEAIFDIDLTPFAPGETFAIQVGHREPTGGASTSNMLVGTAQ